MTAAITKRIVIVCRKPPYGDSLSREAIEVALASSVFEQELAIIFTGDGVWQLTDSQQSDDINSKNHQKLLSALPLYDLDEIYVDNQSLADRYIQSTDMSIPVKTVNKQELAELLEQADLILNF